MDKDKLTARQESFINEYIIYLNGTEAARLAKYTGDRATLAVTASQLLRNPKIASRIREKLDQHAMSANEVLVQLTDIARGDIADALNDIGGIAPDEAVRRGKSHLIKRIKTKTTIIEGQGKDAESREIHETEIEMYDRQAALNTLAKYHNLLTEKVEHSGTVTVKTAHELSDDELAKVVASGISTTNLPG